jgi:hypothetical protein
VSNADSGPAGRSPKGRGGGRASAVLALLDDVIASPALRRLASARPALAPKCITYFVTGPKGHKGERLLSENIENGADHHNLEAFAVKVSFCYFLRGLYNIVPSLFR